MLEHRYCRGDAPVMAIRALREGLIVDGTALESRIAPLSDQMHLDVAKRHLSRPCCRHMTLEENKQKEVSHNDTYAEIIH